MARKRAGDLLNFLSNPEHREDIISGSIPVQLTQVQPSTAKPFPGIVGLGAVTGTGVPPMKRRSLLAEDDDGRPRGFRMDLALAALLGLLVTNIVSFTLGARAGRQSVEPTTPITASAETPTTPIGRQSTPRAPLQAATQPASQHPTAPPAGDVKETGPIPMAGTSARQPNENAATPSPLAESTQGGSTPTAPAAEVSMAGKFVVRLVSLPFEPQNKKTCEKIRAWIEQQRASFRPGVVRTSRGKLVVEAGRFRAYDEAVAASKQIRKLKLGYDKFDSAYVVQRSR